MADGADLSDGGLVCNHSHLNAALLHLLSALPHWQQQTACSAAQVMLPCQLQLIWPYVAHHGREKSSELSSDGQ